MQQLPSHRHSPWHAGEKQLQEKVGVGERMEVLGQKVIRDYMPDQHRDFYHQLPFMIAAAVDGTGQPWATLIEGELQSRYYYLYAEDASRGGRWAGDINMCVAENEFKIVGVDDCFARGYQRMGFKEYDTGRQGSWMVQLSDTPGTQGNQN